MDLATIPPGDVKKSDGEEQTEIVDPEDEINELKKQISGLDGNRGK